MGSNKFNKIILKGEIEINQFNEKQNRFVKIVCLTSEQYFGIEEDIDVPHRRNALVKSSKALVHFLPK